MKKQCKQSGLSAIELLITLFIAASFLTVGYQLFRIVIKDGGESRVLSNASREADYYLQKYKANATNPCTAQSPAALNPTISGLSSVTVNIVIDCPYGSVSSISRIKSTLTHGYPQQTIVNTTYVKPACPVNFVPVPGSKTYGTNDFCVMKFEAKNNGSNVAISQATGLPWANISQTDAATYAITACTGCHLITEAEWLTIAENVVGNPKNWAIEQVGWYFLHTGYAMAENITPPGVAGSLIAVTEHNSLNTDPDTTNSSNSYASRNRRTYYLTNGEIIWDFSGNAQEWTSGQTSGGQPQAAGGCASWCGWTTATIPTHGSLSPDPWPIAIYNVTNERTAFSQNFIAGLGRLKNNANDTNLRGFIRGGGASDNLPTNASVYGAGVYSLILNQSPSYTSSVLGFRVTR